MSASPAVRSLRAAVFAAMCVTLAAAGHGLATGVAPPLWADGAGFLAVFAAGWLLGARERALPGIGAAMLATQWGLHMGFEAADLRDGRSSTAYGMPNMGDGAGMRELADTRTMPGMRHMAGVRMTVGPHSHLHQHAHLHGHAASLASHALVGSHATVAHLLAALAASWWLRRGEAALWSLLRRAIALLPGLAAWSRGAAAPLPVPSLHPAVPAPVPPRQLLLRHAVSRRGPPAPIPYAI